MIIVATPFTATLAGRQFTNDGAFQISLEPGVYEITGSFTSVSASFGFSHGTNGGVQTGSVQSLEGRIHSFDQCRLTYINPSGIDGVRHSFRLRFAVTRNLERC